MRNLLTTGVKSSDFKYLGFTDNNNLFWQNDAPSVSEDSDKPEKQTDEGKYDDD